MYEAHTRSYYYQQAVEDGITGATVANYMSDLYEVIEGHQTLDTVIDLFNKRGYRMCPVQLEGELRGVVSRKNITDFLEG